MPTEERIAFVTVGTTKFELLIESVDSLELLKALREKGYTRLVIQKGNGAHCPVNILPKGQTKGQTEGIHVEYFEYTPSLAAHIASAALVISHAGSGSIFETLTAGRPLIVVPNPVLMDNHQVELGEQLAGMGHLVCAAPRDLVAAVRSFDPSKLMPYARGNVAAIATAIDKQLGFA